ncbi:hypothetical protein EMN47_16005 [Prolixibacteraceae bacterium JC049]|jgi:hypothetical protein|nr:hypothetical protein [Prolixibacteraceae bacterium JC049]
MEKQPFNLNADLFGGYVGVFVKVLLAVIVIYGFIMLLNFFRDKFLNKMTTSREPQLFDLLIILNKLCYFAGWGFVIANIAQVLLNETTDTRMKLAIAGTWDYFTFGIILIFIGLGFKAASKNVIKEA